jgi:hypothetical protein
MSTATNVTWASAIKNHPDFKKSTKSISSFAYIIDNPSFDAATCLRNLGNEPDPIIIFPSAIDRRPLAIHNIKDLGSTRINPDPIPFAIACRLGLVCTPLCICSSSTYRIIQGLLTRKSEIQDIFVGELRANSLREPSKTNPTYIKYCVR